MTDPIERLKAAVANATIGPWAQWEDYAIFPAHEALAWQKSRTWPGDPIVMLNDTNANYGDGERVTSDADAEFIMAARDGVPALLARIDQMEKDRILNIDKPKQDGCRCERCGQSVPPPPETPIE